MVWGVLRPLSFMLIRSAETRGFHVPQHAVLSYVGVDSHGDPLSKCGILHHI
jgi:hypothetical protein